MSKSILKILSAALMVAITALWGTQAAFGGEIPVHSFDITENSSTSLTVTYDGSPLTVTRIGSDAWGFFLPDGFLASSFGTDYQWIEPGSPGFVNVVTFGTDFTRAGTIRSDFPLSTAPAVADGTLFLVGTDGEDFVSATFHDRGDAATVPDTGTTFSLLSVSLVGFAFLKRKLR